MSEIVKILDHADQAEARLPDQYKEKPKMVSVVRIFGDRAQVLEDSIFDVLGCGNIGTDDGDRLDQHGDVVNQKRLGLDDSHYKIALFAKIAENVSNGIGEDLIGIYRLLMQADKVYFNPVFPAKISMTAINATPLGVSSDIHNAILSAAAAGVGIDHLAVADTDAFSFGEDPDVNGQTFGSYFDAGVGGRFANIF